MAQVEKLVGIESPLQVGQKINEIIEKGVGGAFNLFDTMLKDHVLTYEETYGWALQGTYVYKEAVAGSRYGYPDFYNKCTSEKDLGTPTETTLGDNTVTLYVNANGHTFYDIADKEAIDAWYNTYGIAWYYGIDTENERVFLPRTKWFIQPTGEITEINTVNEAGLPNITGSIAFGPVNTAHKLKTASGAFYSNGTGSAENNGYGGLTNTNVKAGFQASRSNPIYGNSDTVQPPSINQLLYICVGNTNVESAVTDVVDVTTTENDTVPLFTGMYFDFTPNNVSWLKAGEQANSGGVYAFTYNELVNILNGETKYGDLKVIDVADMVTGEDYSLYWKVNQEDMTFITPTAISNKALSGGVVGNGMTLGLTDGTNLFGLTNANDTEVNNRLFQTGAYGVPVGSSGTTGIVSNALTYGITTDPTKSGIIAEQSTSQLYFKVANAVQNLELLDAGEVLEAVQQIGAKPHIVDTYVNGASWYRVYSDGWCEQGGFVDVGAVATTTISLLKPYIDTNYTISLTNRYTGTSAKSAVHVTSVDTSSFVYWSENANGDAYWEVKGYIS